MSQNPQPPGTDLLKTLVGNLKNQFFIFAIASIIALSLFGANILREFIPLVYIIVVIVLLVTAVPVIASAFRKSRESAPAEEKPRPSPPAPAGAPPENHSTGEGRDRLSEREQLQAYLDKVMADHNVLRLSGLSSEASDPQQRLKESRNPGKLSDVFISLRVDRFREEPGGGPPTPEAESILERTRERKQFTALEALSADEGRHAVLLGLPGGGKSSILRFLAFRLAEAYSSPRTLGSTMPEWKADVLLPVFVSLARLADGLPARSDKMLDARMVKLIENEIEMSAADLRGFAKQLWREALERGAVFLFDGLDEVAPEQRATVKQAIAAFLSTRSKCRAIVTCRTFSYGDVEWRLEGWPAYTLEPLSEDEQGDFIARWYEALIRQDPASKDVYEKRAETLKPAIFSGDARQLQQISNNPLLLTLIAIVHTHKDELPRSRVLIYKECVELLLLRWQTRRSPGAALRSVLDAMREAAPGVNITLELLLDGLSQLSFEARKGRNLRQGETTLIDRDSLETALRRKLGDAATAEFIRYCETANGLLLAQGSRRLPDRPASDPPVPCYSFPHPSFEEYLAALHLDGLDDPPSRLAELNAESDRWFYVGLFMAEYRSIHIRRYRESVALADELLAASRAASDDGHWRNVWLAGVIWPILRDEFPDKKDATLERRARDKLARLCGEGHLPPRERADAGRALATLGDPRPGLDPAITALDQIEFCYIPPGPFVMGEGESRHTNETLTRGYWLARYPVTVAQFRAFAQARQYQPRDKDSLDGPANHPVVWVHWRDALAFCNWLTDQHKARLPAGYGFTLPSDAEWEKAARGGLQLLQTPFTRQLREGLALPENTAFVSNPSPERVFPWGDDEDYSRMNCSETSIGATSAVGCFPTGMSPYGLLDVSGNVWEWTRSLWSDEFKYPYDPKDGREALDAPDNIYRVWRGGSFLNDGGGARCAARYGVDYPSWAYGFRVAVSPLSL